MTTYNIVGIEVEVPTSTENYVCFLNQMKGVLENLDSNFDKWYNSQGNCEKVYENQYDTIIDFIDPIIERGIKMLNQNGVYSIDRKIFHEKYLGDSLDDFRETMNDMIDEYNLVGIEQEEAREYRQDRKKSRYKWHGYGYGIGDTIKNKAAAGALNVTSGALHSARNAVGNMGSAIVAGAEKANIYTKYKSILRQKIGEAHTNTVMAVLKCIEKNTNCRFDYKIDGKTPDKKSAASIINSYEAGRIPDEKKLSQLVLALANAPDEAEIYTIIWSGYGDENGDLRKMANFFGIPLEEYILSHVIEYCDKIFAKYCRSYIEAENSIVAAVKYEQDVIKAYGEIKEYCTKQKIELNAIELVKKCESTLQEADYEIRTVNGITYETRQIAKSVMEDRKLFYDFLQGKNLNDDSVYKQLNALAFHSEIYQTKLADLFQEEKSLRNPKKLFANLQVITKKYFPTGETTLGKIEIARTAMSLEQKETLIRNITQMPGNEIPVILINFATNGKSGILLTNMALRVYNKGILSFENKKFDYEILQNIICCGKGKYQLIMTGQYQEFQAKSGLSIKEQNQLCKLLLEAIFTIKNLSGADRRNLGKIDTDSIQCVCGSYLPVGQLWCSSCFKIYTKEGKFVDTVPCQYCGNRVPIGKKFCSQCGEKIDENSVETDIQKEVLRICPVCRKLIKTGKRFCSNCGTEIGKEEKNNG